MYIQLTQNKVTLGQTTLSLMDHDDMTLLEVKQASDFTFICLDVQENFSVNTQSFIHDLSYNLYSYNIYCIC